MSQLAMDIFTNNIININGVSLNTWRLKCILLIDLYSVHKMVAYSIRLHVVLMIQEILDQAARAVINVVKSCWERRIDHYHSISSNIHLYTIDISHWYD